jgi:hypothetical protein
MAIDEQRPRLSRGRFLAVALTMPTLGSALGIDGGAIFQIVASENLGLDARAIGIGFGLGVISVPVQVWAARMPLWRARRNLQVFLACAAVQCWVLAGLVAFVVPGDRRAIAALAITVTAELSLSVLYATAWQPLLSYALTVTARQHINSRGRAGGGALLAGGLLVFGLADDLTRIVFLVAVGAVAIALAVSLRDLASPDRLVDSPDVGDAARRAPTNRSIPAQMRTIYMMTAFIALAAWPLFIVYTREVLWPSANLGLVAAVQFAGALLAAAAWRPTPGDVAPRARVAGAGLLLGGVLVSVSASRADWLLDPYRIYLLAMAIGVVSALTRISAPMTRGLDRRSG